MPPELEVLTPEQADAIGLIDNPAAARKRRITHGTPSIKARIVGRIPVQRLPTAPGDKVAVDPETGRYLRKFSDADRVAVEAGVIASHALGLTHAIQVPGVDLRPLFKDLDASPFATYMAAERARQPGRILISPRSLSPQGLRRYVETMAASALAPSHESPLKPISPHALPLMIGGLTLGQMDNLCDEIFGAYGYAVPEEDPRTEKPRQRLSDALCTVGYGPHINHAYMLRATDMQLDSLNQTGHEVEPGQYLRRLSMTGSPEINDSISRLDWLKALDGVQLPEHMVQHGAFSYTHADKLARLRTKVAIKTAASFIPTTDNFGRMALEELQRHPVILSQRRRIDNAMFNRAVRRVYEESWFELDLVSDISGLAHDVEVVMARQLISALASTGPRATQENHKIPATTLLGLALATGVPLGNIIQFAIDDLKRRGDTFIVAETIREIFDEGGLMEDLIIEDNGSLADAYRCGPELEEMYYDMLALEQDASAPAKKRWNRKLRHGVGSLWSHRASNRYLLIKIGRGPDGDEKEYYKAYPDQSLIGVRTQDLSQ